MYSKPNSWPGLEINHGFARLAVAVLVACSIYSGTLQAANPAPYGADFARLDRHWTDAGGVQRNNHDPVSETELEQYRSQVERLEVKQGPYGDSLAEPLTSMGRYFRANGDPQQAVQIYRRALHIVRVNEGLYSQRQIPVLRELLDTFRESGAMATLDERYDYFFRLYGGGQPPFTEVRLRAALEYLRWQREALRLELDDRDNERLLAAVELNEELIDAVTTDPGVDYHWRRELVLSQLRNLYLVQDRLAPALQEHGVMPAIEYMGMRSQDHSLREKNLELIQRTALQRGSELLQELLPLARQQGEAEYAAIQLEQADWLHWNGSRYKAQRTYQAVVSTLREAGEEQLLRQWLGQPVELPDNGAFYQPPANSAAESPVVRARYDVSASGRVSDLQAELVGEGEDSALSKLRRRLVRTRFRPRWENGEAEAYSRLQRDYRVFE